jgi:hypothetical protein
MKVAVVALKEFNGNQPCMSNIYIIMRALHHHVTALCNAPFRPFCGSITDCPDIEKRHDFY